MNVLQFQGLEPLNDKYLHFQTLLHIVSVRSMNEQNNNFELKGCLDSENSGQLAESRVQRKHGAAAFSCYAVRIWNKMSI